MERGEFGRLVGTFVRNVLLKLHLIIVTRPRWGETDIKYFRCYKIGKERMTLDRQGRVGKSRIPKEMVE